MRPLHIALSYKL